MIYFFYILNMGCMLAGIFSGGWRVRAGAYGCLVFCFHTLVLFATGLLRFNLMGKLCGQNKMPTYWYDKDQGKGDPEHTYYSDGLLIRNFFWVQFAFGHVLLYFLTSYVPMREDFDMADRRQKRREREQIERKIKELEQNQGES